MKVIIPVSVSPGDTLGTDTILTATNVAEDDYAAWTAGTYSLGTRKLYDHAVYEVLADPSTADQPDVGAAKASPTWVRVSAANRWKMFDGSPSAQTENDETIEVEIVAGERIDALAAFGLVGETMTVTVDDAGGDGVVYSETIDLQDTSNITSWYEWSWAAFQYREEVALFDLPGAYPDATISVTIDNGTATAKCGELAIGRQRLIGDAVFGAAIGIKDYSTIEDDQFGEPTIIPRRFAKTADIDVSIDTTQAYIIQRELANLRARAAVYVADPNRPETIILGLGSFRIVVEGPVRSNCNLSIKGFA